MLKESHADSLRTGITDDQFEELPKAVDAGNWLLFRFYKFLAVFFRKKAQYCRAQRVMTQRIQNIEFSQCFEIAFVLSPRANLRTRKLQTIGQMRITAENGPSVLTHRITGTNRAASSDS